MGKLTIRLAISILVLYLTIQALFWPLLMKPGTELAWWQNSYAAKIGGYVGFPLWAVMLLSPFSGKANLFFAWVLIVLWTFFFYYLSGIAMNLFRKPRSQ